LSDSVLIFAGVERELILTSFNPSTGVNVRFDEKIAQPDRRNSNGPISIRYFFIALPDNRYLLPIYLSGDTARI